jgi:predicted transcriptional regulator
MAKPEPTLFDTPDADADEKAVREGEADADAGRVVPHEEVAAWLATWGTPDEKPPPKSWFK